MSGLFPAGRGIPISRIERVELTRDVEGVPCALVHIGPLLPGVDWGARIERVCTKQGAAILDQMRRFARATGRAGCQRREVEWARQRS